jgi:hypothetical protein
VLGRRFVVLSAGAPVRTGRRRPEPGVSHGERGQIGQNLRLQIRYNDEILKASKLLETDSAG